MACRPSTTVTSGVLRLERERHRGGPAPVATIVAARADRGVGQHPVGRVGRPASRARLLRPSAAREGTRSSSTASARTRAPFTGAPSALTRTASAASRSRTSSGTGGANRSKTHGRTTLPGRDATKTSRAARKSRSSAVGRNGVTGRMLRSKAVCRSSGNDVPGRAVAGLDRGALSSLRRRRCLRRRGSAVVRQRRRGAGGRLEPPTCSIRARRAPSASSTRTVARGCLELALERRA